MANKDARGRRIHWRRVLLPAVVLLVAFFVVAPVAGTLSGKLSSVTENDQAAFLPDSAESTKSLELETQFAGAQDIPALIVWERQGGLTEADLAAVDEAGDAARRRRGRRRPAVASRSRARTARRSRSSLPLPGDNTAFETLPGIVEDVTEAAQVEGLPSYVTGPGRPVRRLRGRVRGHRQQAAVHHRRRHPGHPAADLPQPGVPARC